MTFRPLLGALVLLASPIAAQAQPDQGAPPAEAALPPRVVARPPGYHCDARTRGPHGAHGLICPLVRPKAIGFSCVCRASPAPGYPYGPPIHGRVIR